MARERNLYVDGAKGLGMLFILLGHVFIPGWNRYIFLFHLPIFFLLAGYFMSARKPVGNFTKQRAIRLLVPYAVTAGLVVLFSIPKSLLEHTSVLKGLRKWAYAALYGAGVKTDVLFPVESIGAIWFLWALFLATLFMRLLMELPEDWKYLRLAIVLLAYITGVVSVNYIVLPFSLQPACMALLYVYMGWLFRRWQEWLKVQVENGTQEGRTYKTVGPTISAIVFVFCLVYVIMLGRSLDVDNAFLMVQAKVDGGVSVLVGSFAASVVYFLGLWYFYKLRPTNENSAKTMKRILLPLYRFLEWMGRNSLLVLCMHLLEQDLIPWKQYYAAAGLDGATFYAAVFFSKLAFTLLTTFIVTHIPKLNALYSGQAGK